MYYNRLIWRLAVGVVFGLIIVLLLVVNYVFTLNSLSITSLFRANNFNDIIGENLVLAYLGYILVSNTHIAIALFTILVVILTILVNSIGKQI